MRRLLGLALFGAAAFACSNTVSGSAVDEDPMGGSSNLGGSNGVDEKESTGGEPSDRGGAPPVDEDPYCGDGEVNQSEEECDDGGASEDCTADCQESVCGDGVVNEAAGEACDDGADNGDYGKCDVSCLFECQRSCPVRVDLDAGNDDSDGSTWTKAFKTIDAAAQAQAFESGGDVWVKAGTAGSIMMQPGVRVFGGFAGTERSLFERPAAGRTTIDNAGVQGSAVIAARNATLDGFVVTGGNASKEGSLEEVNGGGILAIGSNNLIIENCEISGNTANKHGGGLYVDGGVITVTNTTIRGNGAQHGGGVFITGTTELRVDNTTLAENFLVETEFRPIGNGGALFVDGAEALIQDSVFVDNQNYDSDGDLAFGHGAAVFSNEGAAPVFVNVDFHENYYGLGSTVNRHEDSAAVYTSCSFTGHDDGPPSAFIISDTGTSGSTIVNCTFAENQAGMVSGHAGTTVTNTIFYKPEPNAGDPTNGAIVQDSNCFETAEGMLGSDLDVLIRPLPDENGDGIPETYLNQTVENPCFAVVGNDSAADAAGLAWDEMTTALSGCTDFTPVDLGRHYTTKSDAPVCF